MFLGPSRANAEFLKFTECAYAGCAPIGHMPNRFPSSARDVFLDLGKFRDLRLDQVLATFSQDEIVARATQYRDAMKKCRNKNLLKNRLQEWILSYFNVEARC